MDEIMFAVCEDEDGLVAHAPGWPIDGDLRQDGLNVWFDEWALKPGDRIPAKIEDGPSHFGFRASDFGFAQPGMSAHAPGSDRAAAGSAAAPCGRGNVPIRDPLNPERRFSPLRLDDAPVKGYLAQFLYINWLHGVMLALPSAVTDADLKL